MTWFRSLLAKFGSWVASLTETTKDDAFFAGVLNILGKATQFLADAATNNTRPKGK